MDPFNKAGDVWQYVGAAAAAIAGFFGWRRVQAKRNGRAGLSVDVDGESIDFAEFVRGVRGMEKRLRHIEREREAETTDLGEIKAELSDVKTDTSEVRAELAAVSGRVNTLLEKVSGILTTLKLLGSRT